MGGNNNDPDPPCGLSAPFPRGTARPIEAGGASHFMHEAIRLRTVNHAQHPGWEPTPFDAVSQSSTRPSIMLPLEAHRLQRGVHGLGGSPLPFGGAYRLSPVSETLGHPRILHHAPIAFAAYSALSIRFRRRLGGEIPHRKPIRHPRPPNLDHPDRAGLVDSAPNTG
jgi:hypothetical protein